MNDTMIKKLAEAIKEAHSLHLSTLNNLVKEFKIHNQIMFKQFQEMKASNDISAIISDHAMKTEASLKKLEKGEETNGQGTEDRPTNSDSGSNG